MICNYCSDRGWYSEAIKNPSYERNSTGKPDIEPIWIKHSIKCKYCKAAVMRKSSFVEEEKKIY